MEGKSVLFKRFADIDSIDIEIDSSDTKEIINSIKSISKSFGGINLEDIKAPECFIIENELKKIDNSFAVEYNPDFRQKIADSWPISINDKYSRVDWNWEPQYDLNKTILTMIKNLKLKLK